MQKKLEKATEEGLREEILDDGYLTMCSKWRDVKISGKKIFKEYDGSQDG